MKNLLGTIIVLALTNLAQARSIDTTAVLARVTGLELGIEAVTLLEDGRLMIEKADSRQVKTVVLTEAATTKLKKLVMSLGGNIVVKESKHMIVCKMLTIPYLSNLSINNFDYQNQKFGSELKLVLTATTCDISHKVFPEAQHHLESAKVLRAVLTTLAFNAL